MKRTIMIINDIFQFFVYRVATYKSYPLWLRVVLSPWILLVGIILFAIIAIAFLMVSIANLFGYTYCDYCCGFYRHDQMIVISRGTDRCVTCHKEMWGDAWDDEDEEYRRCVE